MDGIAKSSAQCSSNKIAELVMEHFKREHWKFRQEKNMLEIPVSRAAKLFKLFQMHLVHTLLSLEKVYIDGFDLANASRNVKKIQK
ncbi:hypothetical protein T4E_8224 [Trichinella pseudospiralis]|uniref:Uncharacterized protein n=1 Tax=Trichinella pseudospiralis TaxID=6337 RepID=A0A0V0XX73_TRIPS|nr:hypothetical protein T4E_8224 [Trichinella pseudospiralis]